MALIRCPKCKSEVSDMYASCKACGCALRQGAPTPQQNSKKRTKVRTTNNALPILFAIMIVVFFLGTFTHLLIPEPISSDGEMNILFLIMAIIFVALEFAIPIIILVIIINTFRDAIARVKMETNKKRSNKMR